MEFTLNQELESVPEPIVVSSYPTNGLLNSSYKSIVKNNFSKSTTNSIFGIRQRIKSSQLSNVDHIAAILKLSVFFIALIAIF
jgi:hypothetical protein